MREKELKQKCKGSLIENPTSLLGVCIYKAFYQFLHHTNLSCLVFQAHIHLLSHSLYTPTSSLSPPSPPPHIHYWNKCEVITDMSKGVGVRWENLVMGHPKQEEGNEKKKVSESWRFTTSSWYGIGLPVTVGLKTGEEGKGKWSAGGRSSI